MSALLRLSRLFVRAIVLTAVLLVSLMGYGLRRAALLGESEPEHLRRRVAGLRGRTLRSTMQRLGACFVKLGQVMSTRPDLFEPELVAELRELQDRMPAVGFEHARRVVERGLGRPLDQVFLRFEPVPLAAASVAQVHEAQLQDGQRVAVKVLRPGVRAQVERDASLLLAGARLLALHPAARLSNPVGHAREFVEAIAAQTDLDIEARSYARFRANFQEEARIHFPEVHPEACCSDVLTMELIEGSKLDDLPEGDYGEVAAALREAGLKMCLIDGFVHADMHPGNMLLRDDGVLVLLDVGLAKELSPSIRTQFVDMTYCMAAGSSDEILAHFRRYHSYMEGVDWEGLREDLSRFVDAYRKLGTAEVDYGKLVNELLAIGRGYRVRPVTELTMVIVATITVQGIGKQLCPEVNDFEEMARFVAPLMAGIRAPASGLPASS